MMTEQDILVLQAGNKLDALVAEHLMGFSVRHTVYSWRDRKRKARPFMIFAQAPQGFFNDYKTFVREDGKKIRGCEPHRVFFPPSYSTDIEIAWSVVTKMEELGYWCEMQTPFDGPKLPHYWAGFTPHQTSGRNEMPDHWTSGVTLPVAICRAALIAYVRIARFQ